MGRAPRDNGDVRFAIDQFARWIANADSKAGVLGIGLSVVAAAIGVQGRSLVHRLPAGSFGDWASALGLIASGAALALSTALVVRALSPVVAVPRRFSRYSWSVADAPVAELVRADDALDREQAWLMASLLASIARRKFRNLRRAFGLWAFATIAFVAVALGNLGH
jgi:hypothetical protein